MKKQLFKFLVVICLLLGLAPNVALADVTPVETTHEVKITAKNGNRTLSYVAVMISQNGETITYGTTNRNGVATFNLADGTYTATVGYVSGNYSYYGTTEFTVGGKNITATVNVNSEFSKEAAKQIYDRTTYYDHVDIRVNGTFTTGSEGNLITHSIVLKNVELLVKNGDNTLVETTFKDNTETYEWRVTNKRIPKTAVVSLIFDIVLDGVTVRENYITSFSGEEDFIEAIINCDMNQGLDFIIEPTEIIAAALYDVNYVWTGLPEGLANVPATTEHASGYVYTIDTQFEIGDLIVDSINNKQYTFSGWQEWSNATDEHKNKNDIGSDTTITITNDTIIYGVWTVTDLTPTSSNIIINKTFSGHNGRLPENLMFKITDKNTSETHVFEVALSAFTLNTSTGVYTYKFPIYNAGTYEIQELNYNLPGYTFDTTNSTKTNQIVETDLTEEVVVTFNNVYTKNKGTDFHNSGFIVEKADADDRTLLSGAEFTLTNQSNEVIATAITDNSGYAIFMNLREGTYILKETKAPTGYQIDNTVYNVVITCIDSYEVYSATQNAYLTQYEYSVTITPNDHYNSNRNRLTIFNEKIFGSITISKEFGSNSAYNKDNYSSDIKVLVTGENNYNKTVILNKSNNWSITLDNLKLGKYTILELVDNAKIDGYTLDTVYSKKDITLTDTSYNQNTVITNTYTKIPENIDNEASFTVKKTDESGNVLEGAVFGLYDTDNNLVASKTTDKNGIVTFTGFKNAGTYVLKEISAPANYHKIDTEWTVTIELENGKPSFENGDYIYNWNVVIENDNYENGELTVVNEIMTGSLTITKEVQLLSNNEAIEKPEDTKLVTYTFTVIIGNETYTVELKDGESKTFSNIAYGTTYEVIEIIPEDATWTHTAPNNATGTIMTDETSVNMVNVYNINNGSGEDDNKDNDDNNENKVPQTGYDKKIHLYSLMTLLGMIGFILTQVKYKKNF